MTDVSSADFAILPRSLTSAFRCLRDVPILHFAEVTKVNRRGRRQRRIVVVTSTHLYSCVETGAIQRCVALSTVASVLVCCASPPHLSLLVPSAYDMLFYLSDPDGMARALRAASGGRFAVQCVEAPLDTSALRLERPRGFARMVGCAVHWPLGAVGAVPRGREVTAARPFRAADAAVRVGRLASPNWPPPSGGMGGAPTWPLDGAMEAACVVRVGGADYSDDNDTDNDGHSSATHTDTNNTAVSSDLFGASRDGETAPPAECNAKEETAPHAEWMAAMESERESFREALRAERRGWAGEREQWCLLLAAERRNAHQLRHTVTELRAQVVAVVEENLTLREEAWTRLSGSPNRNGQQRNEVTRVHI